MGFTEAIKSVFSKYATFSGRATRPEYWYFALFNIIIYMVAIGLPTIVGVFCYGVDEAIGVMSVGTIIYYIYALASFIPNLAVSVRRLHDTGRSGWNLLWALLPIVGAIVLLVFMISPSNPGENAYGEEQA